MVRVLVEKLYINSVYSSKSQLTRGRGCCVAEIVDVTSRRIRKLGIENGNFFSIRSPTMSTSSFRRSLCFGELQYVDSQESEEAKHSTHFKEYLSGSAPIQDRLLWVTNSIL